uniref:Uncharacterized protein n=1 Tax=Leersia perrieri TaxID=77586 RepID=A0A0D9WTT0_9ORYZ
MAPARRAGPTFQGPWRWDRLLRVRRRKVPLRPPPPIRSPPPPPPASAEMIPHASPPPPPPLAPPDASPGRIPTPSPSVSPSRDKGKKKVEEEELSQPVWMTLLERIREIPSSTFRPFYPRQLERGTRSCMEARSWICQECKHQNPPTQHLLFDLPVFNCAICGFDSPKGAADFGFCFADLAVNGVCPIGNVKKQTANACVATSLASAIEITHRVMMVLLEESLSKNGPFIDIEDLLEKYDKQCLEKGIMVNKKYNIHSLLNMLSILRDDGVMEMDSSNLHKITGWTLLGANDFIAASSTLADGYPLIAGFDCGKRIRLLKAGEVFWVRITPNEDLKEETKFSSWLKLCRADSCVALQH